MELEIIINGENVGQAINYLTKPAYMGKTIVIACDVDLSNQNVNLAQKVKLRFVGGAVLKCAQLNGNLTSIDAPITRIFDVAAVSGTWNVSVAYPEWFGAVSYMRQELETESNGYLYNLRFSTTTFTDSRTAIQQAFDMNAGEVCFSHGFYFISYTVFCHHSNICINKDATIFALRQTASNDEFGVMIEASYTDRGFPREIFSMEMLPMIYGGGCIDCNCEAKIGLELRLGFRVVIKDIIFKNGKYCGLQTSPVEQDNNGHDVIPAGHCFVHDCLFLNEYHFDENVNYQTYAIVNTCNDSAFTNIEIVDYKIGVFNVGAGSSFTNLHAWLTKGCIVQKDVETGAITNIISSSDQNFFNNDFWADSAVIASPGNDITLVSCACDTMRKMLVSSCSPFKAMIFNCRMILNPVVMETATVGIYPPVVVDSSGLPSSVKIIGGYVGYPDNCSRPYAFASRHANDIVVFCDNLPYNANS